MECLVSDPIRTGGGAGVHSSEVKEQRCETGRPPSFRAEVKYMWKYIHHPYVFMAVHLCKHMDNFALITFMLKI